MGRPDREPLDRAFLIAAEVTSELLQHDAIGSRWTGPSALPQMSIGALACHLGRQVTRVAALLASPESALPVLDSVDEHYARAAWTTASSPDDTANDRANDDAEAALGHQQLLERVEADLASAADALSAGTANDTVAVPWQGWALSRDDFLLTRLLEIVVHANDLTSSIGHDHIVFPAPVFEAVRDLLVRLSLARHGQPALVDALTRRERAGDITAF